MRNHINSLIVILSCLAIFFSGCVGPPKNMSDDRLNCLSRPDFEKTQKDALSIDEIIKQGDEITPERLAGYKKYNCEQAKAELRHVAQRFEYAATPRFIEGTLFVGGDIRYLYAIHTLLQIAQEKKCKVNAIGCSDYPNTCQHALRNFAEQIKKGPRANVIYYKTPNAE